MIHFQMINWLSVLAATVAAFVLGGLWFSKLMFAERWVAAVGPMPERMPNPGLAMGVTFVTTFIMATAMALIMTAMPVMSFWGSVRFGIAVGVGIVLTGMISDGLFTGTSRTLTAIQGSYHVLMVVLMSVILVHWH